MHGRQKAGECLADQRFENWDLYLSIVFNPILIQIFFANFLSTTIDPHGETWLEGPIPTLQPIIAADALIGCHAGQCPLPPPTSASSSTT